MIQHLLNFLDWHYLLAHNFPTEDSTALEFENGDTTSPLKVSHRAKAFFNLS
jgi:hypothetical protein